MPYRDDFDAILAFLNRHLSLHFPQNIPHLFSQSNEHRILLDNLISLSMVKLTGQFNFIWMIWIGNAGWFLLVYLFWRFANKNKIQFQEFSPILIAMMCLSHYELMTMAMAGVQHYFQVFFCVISIWFLTSRNAALSLAFFTFAIFSSGGGICLVPVIFLYYIFNKEWRNLLVSIATIGMVLIAYFPLLGYVQPAGHPDVLLALKSPLYLIKYTFGFLGNIGNTYKFSIGLGILFTLYLGYKWKFLYTKYPFLFWLVVYIFSIAMTNAITRGAIGIRTGQGSRYTTYSLILASIVYLTFLLASSSAKIRLRVVYVGFLTSLIIFSYWFVHGKGSIVARYQDLESGVLQDPNEEFAKAALQKASELGYYYPTIPPKPSLNLKTNR